MIKPPKEASPGLTIRDDKCIFLSCLLIQLICHSRKAELGSERYLLGRQTRNLKFSSFTRLCPPLPQHLARRDEQDVGAQGQDERADK